MTKGLSSKTRIKKQSHLPALRQLPSEAHKETNDMPKERVRREKQPRGPLQCQYPERAAARPLQKKTKSTKNKSPLTKKKSARKLQPPTTKPVEVEEGDAAIARGDDAELGSPLNVEADRMAIAATKTSQARVSCSADDTSDHRAQEPTSTSSVDSV
ncbi:hypothetical protein PF004_g29725 [Phytophthora fragariae]|uniref:Uncharacterized protein n=1 Tax=Phytophthora fragariae TaxID=53985 RepID=A0A6G0MFP0_9STRA|nr:hypothetical protein PF004_g29725 [Phytophthora fragariae]